MNRGLVPEKTGGEVRDGWEREGQGVARLGKKVGPGPGRFINYRTDPFTDPFFSTPHNFKNAGVIKRLMVNGSLTCCRRNSPDAEFRNSGGKKKTI